MVITGATGFLGGQLLRHLRKEYRIVALGRRTPKEAGAPEGPGIEWFQVDLADLDALKAVFRSIAERGGAELLLHMAAYYDFTGEDNPEYQRTNVQGTRNLLELAPELKLRRFIHTGSVAACPFPPPGEAITEATPPDADFPYARAKKASEALVREASGRVPTCIVRPAAVFSDWCEYQPLDEFLRTWCSRRWNSRILGGKGLSAVPYLHVDDLLSFYLRVVERCDDLAPAEVLVASPDGCTSHAELFREVTRCWSGAARAPWLVPRPLAAAGIRAREGLGRLTGRMPFERSWMVDYIDLQLRIDASRTRRRLDWAPSRKLHLLGRLPVLIENLRLHPAEWTEINLRRKKVQAPLPPRWGAA